MREPQGYGCPERCIRTRKENLLWITTFAAVEKLQVTLLEFKEYNNETWLIGRYGYTTPSQARQEQLAALAKQEPEF